MLSFFVFLFLLFLMLIIYLLVPSLSYSRWDLSVWACGI